MATLTITEVTDLLWKDALNAYERLLASGMSREDASRAIAEAVNRQFCGLATSPMWSPDR